jgi:uncharacterized cupin superfamily protein
MDEIRKVKFQEIPQKHKSEHPGYEYYKRELVPKGDARQCAVSVYEIPPGKSAYPYHYHTMNEEAFYIISGRGILKTPSGEQEVSAGDFLFFPASEKGAHKLTNSSETDMLVYLDFDTHNEIDAAFYPDSGKIGIWGRNINQLYKVSQQVEYYEGE